MKTKKVEVKTEPVKGRDVRSDVNRQIGYSKPIPAGFYSIPYPKCNQKETKS